MFPFSLVSQVGLILKESSASLISAGKVSNSPGSQLHTSGSAMLSGKSIVLSTRSSKNGWHMASAAVIRSFGEYWSIFSSRSIASGVVLFLKYFESDDPLTCGSFISL